MPVFVGLPVYEGKNNPAPAPGVKAVLVLDQLNPGVGVDQFGRPYEPIWFPPGQEEDEQTSPRVSNGTANIDTR